ncbi:MAG: UbiA family prenyltransferase [Candidatus Sericytochromatia bacterium]
MKDLLLHLRLNMSIVLAPIFLWGFYLAQGTFNNNFWIGFIAFHLFLYGGSNAYNSYYDKDEGPIGGLKNPPKVTESLLYFSLFCKYIGLALSYIINSPFFIIYLIFFIMSICYSHPKTRWKASPFLSVATVGFGQGGLAFIGGWFTQTTSIYNYGLFIFGLFTTVFMSMGVYPLTQLYQIEEDKNRNDITFAVYWGVKKSFIFSMICIFISGISILSVLYLQAKFYHLLIIGAFYLIFTIQILFWAKNFDEKNIMDNYDKIMKLNYSNALGFMGYILLSTFHLLP